MPYGSERIKEKMRIDLRPQRSQLGFRRQLINFLFAQILFSTFMSYAQSIDASGHH